MIVAVLAAFALTSGQQAAPAATPAPVPAQAPATTVTGQAPVATAEPEEQICRRQAIPGSRRSERVCHTRAEWDMIRDNARNNRDTASSNQRDGGGK
ncbi:hypothetical protein [Brevundimonas goettingensis]|jgi:hypothetical protein|uniref:Uncharacterized protein n=1 Tax=Brevundimonas goettingensis TaxID=2774190 RepID=A0A975GWJ2_9CAUL|nr:hypothetical protein [Brevundimonas goettingensis]QTC92667.1 hypothetical protein IFJ75_07340 [Brevundimonas goettingensis]